MFLLEGKTVSTLAQKMPFYILKVDGKGVILRIPPTGKERYILRSEIEGAYKELVANKQITRVRIQSKYSPRYTPYVAAILAKFPNVIYSTRPITLKLLSNYGSVNNNHKNICQLIAPSESCYSNWVSYIIRTILKMNTFDVKQIYYEDFISNREENIRKIDQELDQRASISVFLEARFWDSVCSQINVKSLRNLLIVADFPILEPTFRPSAMIFSNVEKYFEEAFIKTLEMGPLYPSRNVTLQHCGFGWVRIPILEEPVGENYWDVTKFRILPGYKLQIWAPSTHKRIREFELVGINRDGISINRLEDDSKVTIPKDEFFYVAINWKDFTNGKIGIQEFNESSIHYRYIFSILDWLERGEHNPLTQ